MPRKKQNRVKSDFDIGEHVRVAVNLALKKFLITNEQKEYEFPSSLTSEERAYIHQLAKDLSLKSKSRGKGATRYLTVYKREGSTIVQADAIFKLSRSSRQNIYQLVQKFPLTNKERQELLPLTERDRIINNEVKDVKTLGRLMNGIPQVPSLSTNQELLPFRQSLPISSMRDEIINVINNNQVVVISGDTGCGKTTQVPQFILEHCQEVGKPCRIICTQPRRLSAVSVSERVSSERDEKVGLSIGYQIRLESRISPKTVLTYCTDGVLLRTLMGGDSTLATITHILVDEIHERNRFCDFLLIALRDALAKFRSLTLVLMSATMDTQVFTKYFNSSPVISVPGRLFDVEEYFLEDILNITGYMSKTMQIAKKELKSRKDQSSKLETWTKAGTQSSPTAVPQGEKKDRRPILAPILGQQSEFVPERTELDSWLVEEMDHCLTEAWLQGSPDSFAQLLYLIQSENISVDYQHSETSVTPLMVAAGRGDLNTAEQLLSLGANVNIKASNDWAALDWARNMNQVEMMDLIEAYINTDLSTVPDTLLNAPNTLGDKERELLEIYHHSIGSEHIDMDLLVTLLIHIHVSHKKGAILIFLAGYDDIVTLRERIIAEEKRMQEGGKYWLCVLHSKMQTTDQKLVFRPSPHGTRKIILSTNIAETSITINDVIFVIDAGKVKEKSYDALSGVSMLRPVWISQACALQRKGRAGRTQPGKCYHLFSSARYYAMQKYHTPEILRLPLQELCLHTKLLAPPNTPIADFLAKAIEPPSFVITRNAVQLLKTMDALDAWEDLTELGHHLVDLPVEPRLGKMVLYSVVLKCLDPVLTIVCCLSYRDPFSLPVQPSLKRSANLVKKKLSAGSFSDHMTLLRAFQMWQQARSNGWERAFCDKHFVSAATMEMVVGMRTQLLGQLRALGFVRARGCGDIRDLNTNSENWAVVKAALCAGTYPNPDAGGQRTHPTQNTVSHKHYRATIVLVQSWACAQIINQLFWCSSQYPDILIPGCTAGCVRGDRCVRDLLWRREVSLKCKEVLYKVYFVSSVTYAAETWRVHIRGARKVEAMEMKKEFRVNFHPSSVLRECPKSPRTSVASAHNASVENLPSDWLLYEEMSRTGRFCHARCCTLVSPITVAVFAGPTRLPIDAVNAAETVVRGDRAIETESDSEVEERLDGENTMMKLDDWVVFRVDAEGSHLALHLRQKWNSLFLRRMRAPSKPWSQVDEMVLKTLINVLTTEEQSLGLQQPPGVGQRPRAMLIDCYPAGCRRVAEEGEQHDETHLRQGPKTTSVKSGPDSGDLSESSSVKSVDSQTSSPTPSHTSPVTSEGTQATTTTAPRYFVIKAGSLKAIETSLNKGVWAFTPNTERKLIRLFKEGKRVVLVFSVQGSGHFQGFAHLSGDKAQPLDPTSDLTGPNLSAPLPVEWVKRANIPFQATRHLLNPYNENRRVQTSRDGQEIEPSIGETLCNLWDKVPPFVPKAALFNSLRNHEQAEGQTSRNSGPTYPQGRPIRGGYQFPLYNPGYHHYMGYPRNHPPK
uniref:RNA helicase n=1 Tax=Timema douglasi TaxID=61478 RepID=A0A7R8VAS4_TIMDO|nr:unnamed protein product [Timema douglasi]